MTPSHDDPMGFRILMALRWPLALVASAGIVAGALLQVLSRPIPIRIALSPGQSLPVNADVTLDQLSQPLKVAQLNKEVKIKTQEVVTVRGVVDIASKGTIPISGQSKVVISNPVQVKAEAPLPVTGAVDVTAGQPLPVKGEVDVTAGQPLPVQGSVTVETEDKPFKIEFDQGLMGIF